MVNAAFRSKLTLVQLVDIAYWWSVEVTLGVICNEVYTVILYTLLLLARNKSLQLLTFTVTLHNSVLLVCATIMHISLKYAV